MKVKCITCENEFATSPAFVKKGGGKFCSRKCYGKYRSKNYVGKNATRWKGGISKNINLYQMNWSQTHKYQKKARNSINNGIRANKVKRGSCLFCETIKTDGHHYDYSKPFEVIWLCQKCHKKLHAVLRLYGVEEKSKQAV